MLQICLILTLKVKKNHTGYTKKRGQTAMAAQEYQDSARKKLTKQWIIIYSAYI